MTTVICNFGVACKYDLFILWLYMVFAVDSGEYRDPQLAKVQRLRQTAECSALNGTHKLQSLSQGSGIIT